MPESILRYVQRTRESLLLDDAAERNPFSGDDYIRRGHCRSILCLPLIKQGMRMLVEQLTANDRVTIVTYAGTTGIALRATRGDQKDVILSLIGRVRESAASVAGQSALQVLSSS